MKLFLIVLPVLSLLVVACAARMPGERAEIAYFDPPSVKETIEPADEAQPDPEPEFETPEGIVITTGVHGNEPSGYLVQDRLAEMGFTVFGPCNPWGIENNSRYLEDGRDMNRIFAKDDSEEVEAVKAFLEQNPPALLLDLHEDPNGTGAYLIQHGPDDDIGRRIVDALKNKYEFDPEPRFMMVEGEDGLLKPTMRHLRALGFLQVYGLGYYAWATHGCTAIVVECPGSWPEDKRKQYQIDVCRTAAELFAEAAPGGNPGESG